MDIDRSREEAIEKEFWEIVSAVLVFSLGVLYLSIYIYAWYRRVHP